MPGCWCWRRSSGGSAWPSAWRAASRIRGRPERVRHGLAEMIRFRALLIAAGYADANDCDALRADPAFKMAVGRLPESGADLCSQPTMCRLENLPKPTALKRMMAAMVGLFCDSFEEVPRRIVLDIDDTEDRVHGQQQLALFHAHYDSRCFLPIHVYEATSGKPVAVILRPGKTPDGAEVALVLRHLVRAIRSHWPAVDILIRGDSHYARPEATFRACCWDTWSGRSRGENRRRRSARGRKQPEPVCGPAFEGLFRQGSAAKCSSVD